MIRLAASLLLLPVAFAAPSWQPTAATNAIWHDNVTNADRPGDILGAMQFSGEYAVTRRLPVSRDDTCFTGAALTAELWPRYDGLDRAAAGLRLAWQHKFGLGAYAPTFGLDGAGDVFGARESGRAGLSGSVALTARQRLSRFWRVSARHEYARYDARTHAFDRTGHETTLALEFEAAPGWRIRGAGTVRDGGVLSYATPPRPDLLKEGKALTVVTTFDCAVPMVAYYFIARTVSWRLAAAHSLSPTRTLILAGDYHDTEKGAVRYVNRVVTLGLTQRF